MAKAELATRRLQPLGHLSNEESLRRRADFGQWFTSSQGGAPRP